MSNESLTTRTPEDFLLEHGRLPQLGDEIPPWHFRGWLLPYLIDLHWQMGRTGLGGDRWGYLYQIRVTGKLPDEPPPEIFFSRGCPDGGKAYKNLEKCLELVWHDSGSWSSLNDLLRWMAWACGFWREFPSLSEKTQEALYRTFDAKPMLLAPYDYLGQLMSDNKGRGKNANPSGFFPTPHEVVELMVRMNMAKGDWRELLTQTVCDPCVGTGRMLLHASNFSLRLHGMDIDPNCVLATQINGCLYAPWLTYPLPDSLFTQIPQSEPMILTYDGRAKHKDQALLFA